MSSMRLLVFCVQLLVVGLAGCQSSDTGRLTGRITCQGQPVAGADMMLVGAVNPDDRFVGVSGPDGVYQVDYRTMDGLLLGRYRVTITIATLPNGTPFPPGELRDSLRTEGKLVDVTYAFEKDIAGGSNAIDFELTDGEKLKQMN